MKKFLLVLVLLTGCTLPSSQSQITQNVYQGYPCSNQCPAFQQGFDQAKAADLLTASDCDTYPADQITGCQAAVIENQRNQEDFTDLVIQ